jgi:hypothetical protein
LVVRVAKGFEYSVAQEAPKLKSCYIISTFAGLVSKEGRLECNLGLKIASPVMWHHAAGLIITGSHQRFFLIEACCSGFLGHVAVLRDVFVVSGVMITDHTQICLISCPYLICLCAGSSFMLILFLFV